MILHDFLVEHAMFPFPHPNEVQITDTSDISQFEVGMLEIEWKARHALRDDTLVQKLCRTLEDILGDVPLAAGAENYLLASFSPQLQVDERGGENEEWYMNPSEAQSRSLLGMGFFEATRRCLGVSGPYRFKTAKEQSVKGGSSKIDYDVLVNDRSKVLLEVKSPSVMKKAGELLPQRGIELKWVYGQSLVPKILSTAALCLGLRQMEWLFLSCHNYWIVCRLIRDDDHPYLAYSPEITIKDSSEPFRAFLGAILSVIKGVPVERSTYSSDMELDIIEHEGSLPEDENTESELIITSSSPNSPEYLQVWVHLNSLSKNTLALPQRAESRNQRRLWLTRFIASGSTGNVWECHFDNCDDDLFAVKVVEMLHPSDDADRRQRLRNEFNIYLSLEKAYYSGELRDRIAPRCYGAFKGNPGVDVLILDLCEGVLNEWGELSAPERSQVYKLVQDLHRIGIVHGDLEPRNIARARGGGGGFFLIDFSESKKRHKCKESKVSLSELGTQLEATTPTSYLMCPELRELRKCLQPPLQD